MQSDDYIPLLIITPLHFFCFPFLSLYRYILDDIDRLDKNVEDLSEKTNKLLDESKKNSKMIYDLWRDGKCGKNNDAVWESSDDELFGSTVKAPAKKARTSAFQDSVRNNESKEESDADTKPKACAKNKFIDSECEVCEEDSNEDDKSFDEEEEEEEKANFKVAKKRKCILDENASEGSSDINPKEGKAGLEGEKMSTNTRGAKFRKKMKTIYDEEDEKDDDDEDNSKDKDNDEDNDDDVME